MSYTVEEKIKAILAVQFDIDEETITSETDIRNDLGADSLDAFDLLLAIDDEFLIDIPDETIIKLRVVSDLVKYIEANSKK